MKDTCVGCKYRRDYYKRQLTKKEAWCIKLSKLEKSKKNCIHKESINKENKE